MNSLLRSVLCRGADLVFLLPNAKNNPEITHAIEFLMNKRYISIINCLKTELNTFGVKERADFADLHRKIAQETDLYLSEPEAYQIYSIVQRMEQFNIPGEFAEVGVYKGGSAKIISAANKTRRLFLFDTFEGIPSVCSHDDPLFQKGMFSAKYEEVLEYLKCEKNLVIHKGLFPDTAKGLESSTFAFAHIDVDAYESIKSCLKFFYPRLSYGGVLLVHDYIDHPGVRKAVDEFFMPYKIPVFETYGTHAMIVKI